MDEGTPAQYGQENWALGPERQARWESTNTEDIKGMANNAAQLPVNVWIKTGEGWINTQGGDHESLFHKQLPDGRRRNFCQMGVVFQTEQPVLKESGGQYLVTFQMELDVKQNALVSCRPVS